MRYNDFLTGGEGGGGEGLFTVPCTKYRNIYVSTFCARNGGNRKESEGFVLEVSITERLPGRPNFLRHY